MKNYWTKNLNFYNYLITFIIAIVTSLCVGRYNCRVLTHDDFSCYKPLELILSC